MNDGDFRDVILNSRAAMVGLPSKTSWTKQEEDDLENTLMSIVTDVDNAMAAGPVNLHDLANTLNSTYGSNFSGF